MSALLEADANDTEGRLAALARYDILDTPPDDSFDRIARIAARELEAPIALICLLDRRRQWFKAHWGLEVGETPIDQSFCRHAIRGTGVMEVQDARLDPRFTANPLVTGTPQIRFYAGAPLVTPQGQALGSLCVIDTRPRPALSDEQRATLLDLANLVIDKLELRRQLRANAALLKRAEVVEELTSLAAEATSFDVAIRRASDVLLEATGAQSCIVQRMALNGTQLRFVHGVDRKRDHPTAFAERMSRVPLDATTGLGARAMRNGAQMLIRTSDHDQSDEPPNRLAIEAGIEANLFTPFSLFDQHYVFALGFGPGPHDNEDAATLMRAAVAALRPLLRRLLDEQRLALFQQALAACTDPVLITEAEPIDRPGPVIIYANPANEKVTGYSHTEVLGQTPRMFQAHDTDPAAKARIRHALQHWQPVRETLLNQRKDGAPFWIELNISPVANADGLWTHWISIQRDLTAARALAEQADAVRRDLAALIEAMPGVLMRHQPRDDGKWTRSYVAPSVVDLTGFTVEEAMTYGWWVANVDGADLPGLYASLHKALAGGQATNTFRFRCKDRHWIWVRLIMNGSTDRFGRPEVIGIWSDVTHERELTERLAQSVKLAQLGEMATGMAHELNQPLAAISLAAENAGRELARLAVAPQRVVRRMELIVEMASRASDLIDHMRVFGRIGTEPTGPVRLHDVVAKALSLIGAKLRAANVRVRADLPQDLPPVLAKAVPLEQVMINLFSNACDAYTAGHDSRPDANRIIQVQARLEADHLAICVSDHAGGIPPKSIGQIFQPFFTTKVSGQGTGLGLSISYGIISDLGGTIEAGNEGGGAQFHIRLPVARAD